MPIMYESKSTSCINIWAYRIYLPTHKMLLEFNKHEEKTEEEIRNNGGLCGSVKKTW